VGEENAKQLAFDAVRALRYDNGKGYFWINDFSLKLLMHPLKPKSEGEDMSNVRDGDGKLHWQSMGSAVQGEEGAGFVDYSYKGPQFDAPVAKISYVKAFKPWGIIVGTGVYVDDIEAQFFSIAAQSTITFLVIVGLVMFFAVVIASSILTPLESMVKNMGTAAKGDLQITILDQQRRDELGQVNRSFATLLDTFRNLISHSQVGNRQITEAVEQSVTVSSQTEDGMNRQYAETDSLASAVEELAVTLQEVSANTVQTNDLTANVRTQIAESNGKMNRTVESVSSVSESVENASHVIRKLEQDIKQIDGILDVIRNISEQTNLLALNAAIEAARAGESGRGFAVVADEVRSLAQRTHESTEEIQTMTEQLQSEALKAVSVMERSVEQAKDGAGFAVTTGQDLQEATESVNAVTERIAQITHTVEQQSSVVEEVNRNVASIRDISRQTKEGSEVMAGNRNALKELTQSTNNLLKHYKV
jgi:methyl-accepting chemotaxis protein